MTYDSLCVIYPALDFTFHPFSIPSISMDYNLKIHPYLLNISSLAFFLKLQHTGNVAFSDNKALIHAPTKLLIRSKLLLVSVVAFKFMPKKL